MYAYVGMNAENIEIIIDDISLTPANRKTSGITTCLQLVKNGDAEIGGTFRSTASKLEFNSNHLYSLSFI